MKILLLLALFIPSLAKANFIFQYGLNYSSDNESTNSVSTESSKIFHKLFLGASVNRRKTVFFGWNINSWSNKQGESVGDYSMTEMGPRVTYFFSETYNFYATAEWNPYAKGDRTPDEVSGSSLGFGVGYRFKISRLIGLGAGLHYHGLSIKESKSGQTETNVSDTKTSLMPMLELTILTR